MPSWELFDAQPQEYRDAILPPGQRTRLSVEAGAVNGWGRYVGLDGASIGMSTFGASAPGAVLLEQFGFTPARISRGSPQADKPGKLINGVKEMNNPHNTVAAATRQGLATLRNRRIPQRIRERDHTVWRPDPHEIADRLGWLDAGEFLRPHIPQLTAFGGRIRNRRLPGHHAIRDGR